MSVVACISLSWCLQTAETSAMHCVDRAGGTHGNLMSTARVRPRQGLACRASLLLALLCITADTCNCHRQQQHDVVFSSSTFSVQSKSTNTHTTTTTTSSFQGTTTFKPGRASKRTRKAFESMSVEDRQQFCEVTYPELYSRIDYELRWWNTSGITYELMRDTIGEHTLRSTGSARKGFVAGFRNGRAVLPDKPLLTEDLAHHTALFFLYMKTLVDLERLFGPLLPDMDFVISTIDRPLIMAYESSAHPPQPVMRFCKTPSHSDILIPIFHFMMAHHNNDLASKTAEINAEFPWASRQPTLFGRFSLYERHMHTKDPYTVRRGENGSDICFGFSGSVVSCLVRSHFIDFSRKQPGRIMDVATAPKIPMQDHAKYKYLVHLDGQGLSSRLDQLLSLGSLIFKEESGYYAYYHHLLKPYQHYVPFWKEVPEEILSALQWAAAHDQEAQQIGLAAQQVAAKYLSREARACYWFKLLRAYGKLLRYTPAEKEGRRYRRYNLLVSEYLETEARAWEEGFQLKRYPFSP